ncbi:hypothetical protein [Brevundimonas sp. FT23028]|uniref:hypothetical protein n=1 Tax=Brevundimonas sp. FT23028 TaxID=3393748 RepID=UPI003B5871D1
MKTELPVAKRFKHPLGVAVHEILWRDWDPIGVFDWGPNDEYDAYVWPVIGKVMRRETAEEVAAYLAWASDEHMQCPQPEGRNLEIARKLVRLRPGS